MLIISNFSLPLSHGCLAQFLTWVCMVFFFFVMLFFCHGFLTLQALLLCQVLAKARARLFQAMQPRAPPWLSSSIITIRGHQCCWLVCQSSSRCASNHGALVWMIFDLWLLIALLITTGHGVPHWVSSAHHNCSVAAPLYTSHLQVLLVLAAHQVCFSCRRSRTQGLCFSFGLLHSRDNVSVLRFAITNLVLFGVLPT